MDSSSEIKQEAPLQDQEQSEVNTLSEGYKSLWDENSYYRDGFKILSFLVNLQVIIIVIISVSLYFHVSDASRQDNYFAERISGNPIRMTGLNRPNTSGETLSSWVSKAMVQIMTFGFNDIEEMFEISKNNFTPDGWKGFRKAMIETGLISTVMENQQVVTSAPVSVPVLSREGIIKGKYSWVFDTKILITFRAGGSKRNSTRRVLVTLQEMPTSENPYGMGISEFYIY